MNTRNRIPTPIRSMKIKLREPTVVSSGYLGRGVPAAWEELPAGTEVNYSRQVLPERNFGCVEVRHRVSVIRNLPRHGRQELSTTKVTYHLEQFNPQTYYRELWQIGGGRWVAAGGHTYVDDGFGNLIRTDFWSYWSSKWEPRWYREADYSGAAVTFRTLDDCVVGSVMIGFGTATLLDLPGHPKLESEAHV